MFVSSINVHNIVRQEITNGLLITEFVGEIGHLGGTLVCEPVKPEQVDATLSDTVTRLRSLFWDRGQFTPKPR